MGRDLKDTLTALAIAVVLFIGLAIWSILLRGPTVGGVVSGNALSVELRGNQFSFDTNVEVVVLGHADFSVTDGLESWDGATQPAPRPRFVTIQAVANTVYTVTKSYSVTILMSSPTVVTLTMGSTNQSKPMDLNILLGASLVLSILVFIVLKRLT